MGFFLEDCLDILIMYITDIQEGMLYDLSELRIDLLSGPGHPLILFYCNRM